MNVALLSALLLTACGGKGPTPNVNPDDPDDPAAESWPELPALDEAIVAQMENDHLPGLAACIVKDGAVAWCQGYGDANIETGVAVTPSTPFLIASVSKAVVGLAVERAVQDGDLRLDDKINNILDFDVKHPDYPNKDITLSMLVSHTSGIADNWDVMDTLYTDGDSPLSLEDYMRGYLVKGGDYYDDYWNFTDEGPGGAADYSNTGSALAALVLEQAVGQPFDAYCEEQIFAPLGLENTSWMLSGLDEDSVAMPYTWRRGDYQAEGLYGFPDYPSGQLRIGASPLARILAAVMNGGELDGERILSESAVADLFEIQYPDLDKDQGVFWYRWTLDGEQLWGHNGGETGAAAEIGFWDDGVGFVLMMNAEDGKSTLPSIERALREAAEGI